MDILLRGSRKRLHFFARRPASESGIVSEGERAGDLYTGRMAEDTARCPRKNVRNMLLRQSPLRRQRCGCHCGFLRATGGISRRSMNVECDRLRGSLCSYPAKAVSRPLHAPHKENPRTRSRMRQAQPKVLRPAETYCHGSRIPYSID